MKNKQKFTTFLALAFALALGGTITSVSAGAETGNESSESTSSKQTFDFTTATSFDELSMFSVGVDPETNNDVYTQDSWVTYAKTMDEAFDLDGGLKVDSSIYSGDNPTNNRIYVRYNAKTLQYFEAEMTYSYTDTARWGWAGFMFGYTNYERQARWGDSPNGAEFFVQNEGKGTYAGSKFTANEWNEGATPENWTMRDADHTLSIVVNGDGITFKADGTVVNTLSKADLEGYNYEITDASVGFMLTNAQFTVKSFSVTDLHTACVDNDTNHACDFCGESVGKHEAAEGTHICEYCGEKASDCVDEGNDNACDICGKPMHECADENKDHICDNGGETLSKCTDDNKDHNCDVCGKELSQCADDNKDHNCDICSAELSQCGVDADKDAGCDVCGKLIEQMYLNSFDFTSATDFDALNMFSAGIDPNMASEDWTTHAKAMNEMFTLDNGLKVNTALYGPDGVSENNVYVRYNKQNIQYFKAELKYSYDDASRDGWAGFILGYTNYERKARWGDSPNGLELFVQKEGKGTYSSGKLNNSRYTEGSTPADWTIVGEHTLTVIAVKSNITLYADGVRVISISEAEMQAKGFERSFASIGFVLSNAQFTAKSFKMSILDENGEEHVACVDEGKDHACDVCKEPVGTHEAAAGTHICEYCGEKASDCVDEGKDHACDVCGESVGKHEAAAGTHICEYCGEKASDCVDEGKDHVCDVCGETVGKHEAAEGTHICEYCGVKASDCVDEGNDNACDICGEPMHVCVDEDNDHMCDNGGERLTNCVDDNDDHLCDICTAEVSQCADDNDDHNCDICGKEVSQCADDNDDHNCDICGEELSQCSDTNKDKLCDVCGKMVGQTYLQNYDFASASDFNAVDMFSVGIDPQGNSDELGYTGDSWVTHARDLDDIFTLTEKGLQIKTSAYVGDDVGENNIYVRYNEKELQYFKAELKYSYDDASRNGWAGFILGYTDYARKARWGDSPNGLELFVQKEGKGTYSSGKLNNSGYTEGSTPADWTIVGEHTLTVIAIASGITLYADGVEVIHISAQTMQEKGYDISVGSVGFMFTNAQFTAQSFKVTPLNEEGEDYIAVESVEVSAATEVNQFEGLSVTTTVLPENAGLKTVKYELPAGAVENNGKIYFAKPGTYTVKVVSVDQPTIYDEFTVTVKANDKYYAYDTTESGAANGFDNYFVTSGGSKDGTMYPIANYWTFNADGTITLTEKKGSGVDSGYVLLYLKDIINGLPVESNSFELTYMVKTDASPNGWHGVGFALSDKSGVPNQVGVSAFIQEDAMKATIWGSGVGDVGGPTEINSLYTRNQWNMVKVRVYGEGTQTIEIYVNDMSTPVLSTTGTDLPASNVALFTTTTVTLGNVYFAYLDAEGEAMKVVYPESVQISNAPTTAEVGDKLQLMATIAPADVSNKGLLFTSSNALVATVNADGNVTFLSAGETTITVKCVANPAIIAEFTVTVTEKEVLPTSVTFDARPTTAVVGDTYTLFVTVLPEDATNYAVTFTSSNTDVATVDEDGRLTYVGAGETTITVTCVADESITASFTLTVTAASTETPDNEQSGSNNEQGGSNNEQSGTNNDQSGSTSNKKGCSSAIGASFILPILVGAFVAKKKKKD